ncbi:hypothetical protein Metvu_0332 [Methanocaldococcus vulcanius M7]|uniref:Uncharacterized protein n=1 Tax=Methanocaldococcus vulcanius (strain ATCC 700851 / DSM 12094 / M7) TaxID=579137 RepID=C9RF47_METVM|nr:hypothetical protein [Methanocaldococcus vulcanius]ACX72199.1 hypothetical protein Metvu_0332 [Methanocaldococcus vulcanius M7]
MNNKKIDRYGSIVIIIILTLSILEYVLKHPYGILAMKLAILAILLNILYICYKFIVTKLAKKK